MGKKRRKRRSSKKAWYNQWYMLVFLIMIVFFLAIASFPEAIGLDPSIGITLTRMFPTLFLTCIGIYMVSTTDKVGRFGGTISLGLGLCLFLDEANTNSLISADMLGGLTLIGLQTWVMAFSIMFGAIFFSSSR